MALDEGVVNGLPAGLNWLGGQLRLLQTGRAQSYLLILVVGVLALVGLYLLFYSGELPGLAAAMLPR
jgi:hypothetical protein